MITSYIFLSLENHCAFFFAKEKTWKNIFNTNSELSQNRTEKHFMPFKTTVNWLFNDIGRCLIIGCFDWKIGIFHQTVVMVYYIFKESAKWSHWRVRNISIKKTHNWRMLIFFSRGYCFRSCRRWFSIKDLLGLYVQQSNHFSRLILILIKIASTSNGRFSSFINSAVILLFRSDITTMNVCMMAVGDREPINHEWWKWKWFIYLCFWNHYNMSEFTIDPNVSNLFRIKLIFIWAIIGFRVCFKRNVFKPSIVSLLCSVVISEELTSLFFHLVMSFIPAICSNIRQKIFSENGKTYQI